MCFSYLKFVGLNISLLRKVESFKRLNLFLIFSQDKVKGHNFFPKIMIKNITFHGSKQDNHIKGHNRGIQEVKRKEQAMNLKAIGWSLSIHDVTPSQTQYYA